MDDDAWMMLIASVGASYGEHNANALMAETANAEGFAGAMLARPHIAPEVVRSLLAAGLLLAYSQIRDLVPDTSADVLERAARAYADAATTAVREWSQKARRG